jgi:sugar lactone lactonase YvrE
MRTIISAGAMLCALAGCQPDSGPESPAAATDPAADAPRTLAFADGVVFPAGRGLHRAEDGEALPDGRIIVSDQVNGLAAIAPDGSVSPFGRFADAGYRHSHETPAGPNGVTLEPDGAHLLVADVFTGAIYRVNIATEAVELIHDHPFGANTAVRDSTGAIWFTQSTENPAGPDSEARLLGAPMTQFVADGALFRIAPPSGDDAPVVAEPILTGLAFANSLVIDEARGELYLSETMADQITAYKLSLADGALSDRRVLASVPTPDNIEMDETGQLWVASPVRNELVVINLETGETRSAFRAQTDINDRVSTEWARRVGMREPVLDLFTPDLWAPMPGLVTGVIFTPGGGPIYVSGLGDALVRLETATGD